MRSIESRLRKLEEATPAHLPTVLRFITNEGETADECIRRNGYDPEAEGYLFIVREIVKPSPIEPRMSKMVAEMAAAERAKARGLLN